jgi:hypothetical protein
MNSEKGTGYTQKLAAPSVPIGALWLKPWHLRFSAATCRHRMAQHHHHDDRHRSLRVENLMSDYPRTLTMYQVSVRQVRILASGFLQTPLYGDALAFG